MADVRTRPRNSNLNPALAGGSNVPAGGGGGGGGIDVTEQLLTNQANQNGSAVESEPGEHLLELINEEMVRLGLTDEKITSLGLTRKDLLNLLPPSVITDVGGPYCPDPKSDVLLRGYKGLVKAIQLPEMRQITKTDVSKEIDYVNKTIPVLKTSIKTKEIEHIDQVIVVRKVAKTRPKIFYRIVEEVRDVTEMEDVVEYINVPRIEKVPFYSTEYVDKEVPVPVVKEKHDTLKVEVPTGKFCEYSVDPVVTATSVVSKPRSGDLLLLSKNDDNVHHNVNENSEVTTK